MKIECTVKEFFELIQRGVLNVGDTAPATPTSDNKTALEKIIGDAVAPGPPVQAEVPEPEGTIGPKGIVPEGLSEMHLHAAIPEPPGPPVQTEVPEPPGPPVQTEVPEPPGPPVQTEPPSPPERDGAGLPWDERIHASSKAINADGTWRRRKGVPQCDYDRVAAEITGKASVTYVQVLRAISATAKTNDEVKALLVKHGMASVNNLPSATPEQLEAIYGEL